MFNKMEDEEASDGEDSNLVESYPCEQSRRDGKCRVSALPCSHFVEVSACDSVRTCLIDTYF